MNDVKVLANAIRLELLTELRTARSPSVVYGIAQRAEVLTLLDRDFGGYQLSAETEPKPQPASVPTEPNLEFVRAHLRFRDDGRDWSGEILLDSVDGDVKRAVCAGLGGETALVRLDGASRMYEFSRFTGECVDAEYKGKLRIAPSELYRVHPETYRVREQAGREFAQMRSRFRELEQETERKTKLSWEVSYQGANAPTKEQSSS